MTAQTDNNGGNGGNTAVIDSDYDPGSFKVGDRVMIADHSPFQKHVGASGKVIRIDSDIILPIIVWLDVWGNPTAPEGLGLLGLPTCASELVKVEA